MASWRLVWSDALRRAPLPEEEAMTRGARFLVLAVLLFTATVPGVSAHAPSTGGSLLTDDGAMNSGKDTHVHDAQHGTDHGHLAPRRSHVDLIGSTDLFAGAEQPGRIGDVSATGNYAYLTLYYEPECDRGGIQVVDISDPARPKAAGVIPSHVGTFSGE